MYGAGGSVNHEDWEEAGEKWVRPDAWGDGPFNDGNVTDGIRALQKRGTTPDHACTKEIWELVLQTV